MVTFAPEALIVEKLVARRTLTQLNRLSLFTRAGMGDFEPQGTWEVGDTVKFRRPRISEAVEYDPRTGNGLTLTQPGYITGELSLEALLANGFPIYSSDYKIDTYVRDFSDQMALSIGAKFDTHLYNKYRTPTHSASGEVSYAAHPPIACVAVENPSGQLVDFNRYGLVNAGTALDLQNVPASERYALISSTAKGAYIGEAIPVDAGYVEGMAGGASMLVNGMPIGAFTQRHGFAVGGSNTIGRQDAVADLDSNAGNQSALAIAAAAADTHNGGQPFFLKGDMATPTSLGAIRLTLTTTGDLQNVAVGQVARIGANNATAKAYGVILRVDVANKYVWLVPFSTKGAQLSAANINTSTDQFSIPEIPSISIACHKEALVYASRLMKAPSEGSGAVAATQQDAEIGLAMQIWRGSYDVTRFRESLVATLLMGAKLTDYRKAVLILSL